MKNIYENKTINQRERLLEWLREEPITTLQARHHLDILSVAPRIYELRHYQNLNIITTWFEEATSKGKHTVARYILLPGKFKKERIIHE